MSRLFRSVANRASVADGVSRCGRVFGCRRGSLADRVGGGQLDGSLVLVVEPTRSPVSCPRSGQLSRRRHSRYQRHPVDPTWRGRTVHLRVHTRWWFCDAPGCSQKIFAERSDSALATYARRTDGATELLQSLRFNPAVWAARVWPARWIPLPARMRCCGCRQARSSLPNGRTWNESMAWGASIPTRDPTPRRRKPSRIRGLPQR
jgi:hypothetical protein